MRVSWSLDPLSVQSVFIPPTPDGPRLLLPPPSPFPPMTPLGVEEPNGVLVVGVNPLPGLVVVGVPDTGIVPLLVGLQQQQITKKEKRKKSQFRLSQNTTKLITKKFGTVNKKGFILDKPSFFLLLHLYEEKEKLSLLRILPSL